MYINAFNQRITHILNGHKNALLGNKPWSELSSYVFGLEPQNEPVIFDHSFYVAHLSWICNAAKQAGLFCIRAARLLIFSLLQIRNNVGDKNQLIFTGGSSAAASVQAYFFGSSCTAIDVVAIHDYTDAYDSYLPSAISAAKATGKKLVVEEWGSLVGSSRTTNLNSNVQKINSHKVPWIYWELISNADPHQGEDYEIQVNGADWGTISVASRATDALTDAPFDFSASLKV
ncbi:hypothetical protein C8R47DRAFT_727528 [Mycena vitilis]|nr:hypothetical protein C8R47DRAFT_727528 [Mycena vitilis]